MLGKWLETKLPGTQLPMIDVPVGPLFSFLNVMDGLTSAPMNSAQAAEATAPPCHTIAEAKSGDSDTQTPEKQCSSCDDCAVSSAFTADTDPITNTQSDLTFVTLINSPTVLPRPEVRLLRTTGPPPRQPLGPFDSPFSRFDTQLI